MPTNGMLSALPLSTNDERDGVAWGIAFTWARGGVVSGGEGLTHMVGKSQLIAGHVRTTSVHRQFWNGNLPANGMIVSRRLWIAGLPSNSTINGLRLSSLSAIKSEFNAEHIDGLDKKRALFLVMHDRSQR